MADTKIQLSKFVQSTPDGETYWGWFFPKEEFPSMVQNLICTTPLAKIEIVQTNFVLKKKNGTVVNYWQTSSVAGGKPGDTQCIIEKGYTVDFTGKWKWIHVDGLLDPTSTDGDWGNKLPLTNVESQEYVRNGIAGNLDNASPTVVTIKQEIYRKRTAPTISNNVLVAPTGNDSQTASVTIEFCFRRYFGLTTGTNVGANVKSLDTKEFCSSSSPNFTSPTITTKSNEYVWFAYPSIMGKCNIKQDDAYDITGAFTEHQITIENLAGEFIPYIVYTSNNPGAFKNNKITFIKR